MNNEGLTILDNRTGLKYELAIENGALRTIDLRQIKTAPDDFGLLGYDPAFTNTASCKSAITFIDGERGILRHRGYPIEQLAERCTFLEVAYLLVHGELPSPTDLQDWQELVTSHTMVHEKTKDFMRCFPPDAHPMGILVGTLAALSTIYQEPGDIVDPQTRRLQIVRLIAKVPTIAACLYRHSLGYPFVYPDNRLSYIENFMHMLWSTVKPKYVGNPVLARALDVLFILHADHEQNCSANAMRCVGSAHAGPYLAAAAAAAALAGPLHGGANEAVLHMLDEICSKDRIPAYIKEVKEGRCKLMGFGHRVYKNYDPRARIIKQIAKEVFEVTGKNPKLEIALELERIALDDEYFITRKLYPNVDFYSGIIYQAMGFRPEMFTVLFALPRMAGWLAQWQEMLRDGEQKIARPRQVYIGNAVRDVEQAQGRDSFVPPHAHVQLNQALAG